MHAAIPNFGPELQNAIRLGHAHGVESNELEQLGAMLAGGLVAEGMAIVLKLAFGALVLLGEFDSGAKNKFFEDNFVIRDPNAAGGKRYYQGKFLFTTLEAEEDMNVLLEFCPDPQDLYIGDMLNPAAVVKTRALSNPEAEALQNKAFGVDLVFQFKDISAVLGLLKGGSVDLVGLLLQNQVRFTGNTGHLFKFGNIGASMQAAVAMKA